MNRFAGSNKAPTRPLALASSLNVANCELNAAKNPAAPAILLC